MRSALRRLTDDYGATLIVGALACACWAIVGKSVAAAWLTCATLAVAYFETEIRADDSLSRPADLTKDPEDHYR
ncbi:hypothetical protein ACW73L_07300 [Methylolobus aquaticus]